jgi:hypothetical protein
MIHHSVRMFFVALTAAMLGCSDNPICQEGATRCSPDSDPHPFEECVVDDAFSTPSDAHWRRQPCNEDDGGPGSCLPYGYKIVCLGSPGPVGLCYCGS